MIPTASLVVLPVGIVAAFIVAANLITTYLRLRLPYPVSPWEAGLVVEAWRTMRGDDVYALSTDHATHMYGPLVTMVLAATYRFTGPVLETGRILSTLYGISTIALLVKVFAGRGQRLLLAASTALLLAANSRTTCYFTETRPDMAAFFFATIALIVLYQGLERSEESIHYPLVLLGSALFVVAGLFKQTAFVFSFIPFMAALGRFGTAAWRKRLFAATIPILAVLLALGAIHQLAPNVWHYTIYLFRQYHIPVDRAARIALEFFLSVPVFLLALMHWLSSDGPETWRLPRVRWLLAAILCTLPVSMIAAAKDGGAPNSLIPALLSVSAFCVWRAPHGLALLRDPGRPFQFRFLMACLFACAMFTQAYPDPRTLSPATLTAGHGVKERALVIAETRALPGKVVCPDDPTIPLLAKGYAGRSAVLEADAAGWDFSRTTALQKEIQSADYVIVMRSGSSASGRALVTTGVGLGITDDLLLESGFGKSSFATASTPVYVLWRRLAPRMPNAARL
jgi:hypothetical protein